MVNFIGVIIEESLADKSVLKKLKILSTEVEQVTSEHATPWIKTWTLYTIEVDKSRTKEIAREISKSLDSKHEWYADFKNDKIHFIIFRGKVFTINRTSKKEYQQAIHYGISLGIPVHQLDFSSDVKV